MRVTQRGAAQLLAAEGPDICFFTATEMDMGGIPFDPRVLSLVNAQRKVFESLGCIVEEAEPDWTGALEAIDTLRAWGYAASQSENVRLHRDLVKDTIQWEVARGSRLSGADIAHAHTLRSKAWDSMRIFQEKYEYFIVPTHTSSG